MYIVDILTPQLLIASIFGVFSCKQYDSDDTVPGEGIFMTQDLSISCESQRYATMRLYAILMIFVYPVGIPLFYLYALNRAKRYIKFPSEHLQSCEEENDRRAVLKSLRKLYVHYKPEFWYWEVIDVFYRYVTSCECV